MLQCT